MDTYVVSDDSDDETNNERRYEFEFNPSYILIAIDTHPSMFVKQNDQEKIPFRCCLEACYQLADSLVLQISKTNSNHFAVVLTGVEFPLIEFKDNVLNTVKFLEKQTKLSDDELIKSYQRKGSVDISLSILNWKKKFTKITNFYKRILIYVTNDDNPAENDSSKSFAILNEIKSFDPHGIFFRVLPTDRNFNFGKFYSEAFSLLPNLSQAEEICEDTEGLIKLFSTFVVVVQKIKTVKFYPFLNNKDRYLICSEIKVCKEAKLLESKFTADGKPIKNVYKKVGSDASMAIDNAAALIDNLPSTSRTSSSPQDSKLPLGLSFIFASKRYLKTGLTFGKTFAIQNSLKEELSFFHDLWQYCVDNEVVLVCVYKYKRASMGKYCELTPILMNNEATFAGMFLPSNYFNTHTSPEAEEEEVEITSTEEMKNVVGSLVDSLTFEFNTKMIPHVGYRKKYLFVKKMLLDQKFTEEDEARIDKEVKVISTDEINELIEDDAKKIMELYDFSIERKKRKNNSRTTSGKKVKSEKN